MRFKNNRKAIYVHDSTDDVAVSSASDPTIVAAIMSIESLSQSIVHDWKIT